LSVLTSGRPVLRRATRDWAVIGQMGLLSTVAVLYVGHVASGIKAAHEGQVRDSEAILQSIERSIYDLGAGKQPPQPPGIHDSDCQQPSTSNSNDACALLNKLNQIDTDLKSLRMSIPAAQPSPAPHLAKRAK
jgi:hypothetical protein